MNQNNAKNAKNAKNAEKVGKLSESIINGLARDKLEERSSITVGRLEFDSLLAAAEAARNGLDCLTGVLSQTPIGKSLLPMLGVWFQDYETAIDNFNTVSRHRIHKGDYRAK